MNEIQEIIDSINEQLIPEIQLVSLLKDPRALVRANVLMSLPRLKLNFPSEITNAVLAAAIDPSYSAVRLIGTTTQKRLALATLAWMHTDESDNLFKKELDNLDLAERGHIEALVAQGPIT